MKTSKPAGPCVVVCHQSKPRSARLLIIIKVLVGLVALIFAFASPASQVFSWGRNDYGQTSVPTDLTNAVAISAGFQHCLALRSDGTLRGWGQNTNGQLNFPAAISNNVVAISAGYSHNLARLNDGTLVAWGAGMTNTGSGYEFGQSIIPAHVTNVIDFAAGGYFSMALLADRTVAVWGRNNYGQTNVPVGLTNVAAIAAGGLHCLALKEDGTVVGWGYNGTMAGLSNVVGIFAGAANNYVIKSDGSLVAWGENSFGQNNVPAGVSNVVLATGGGLHSAGLMADGTPRAWGTYDSTLPAELTNLTVAIRSGYYMGLALTNEGAPVITAQPPNRRVFQGVDTAFRALVSAAPPLSYQWSFNGGPIPDATNALLSLPAVQTNQVGIYGFTASNSLGVVVSSNATLVVVQQPPIITTHPVSVVTYRFGPASFTAAAVGSPPLSFQWRFNGTNLPGATNTTLTYGAVPPALAGNFSVLVSNEFGSEESTNASLTILAVRDNGDSSYNNAHYSVPLSLTNAVAIAAGSFHSMALKPDKTLVVWGNNQYGQVNIPAAATNIMAIAARGYTCAIVRSNGTVFMWGDGYEFNGYNGKTNPPASATNIGAIVVGDYHCLALRKNGTVVGWGRGNEGQTNAPASATNIMAIAVGAYHSLALRSNGTLIAWGQNTSGQTNIPTGLGLTNVIAIAAAANYNFALKSDGTAVGWGGANTTFSGAVRIDTGSYSGSSYFSVIRADGGVVGGYVSGVSNATAIAAGGNHNLVLIGDGAPCLYWPPASLPAAHPGDNVSTRVLASGSGPVIYQWQLNGVNVVGATNATLTLTNIPITSAGSYQCVISNSQGVVVSPPVILSITRWPLLFSLANGDTEMTADGFKLRVTGLAGAGPLVVQASTNLLDWQPVFTNQPSVGSVEFVDSNATNRPASYYRASEGP